MANSSIYEKIEKKGALDAEKIYQSGLKRAQTVESEILNAAQAEADQIISKCQSRNADIIKTKTTEIEQAAKQKSLLKKKELIDEVINQAIIKLKHLSDNDWINIIVKLILLDELKGNEVIIASKDEQARFLRLFGNKLSGDYYQLDQLNKRLDNEKYQLKLARDTINIEGGFIILGEFFDIDYSYRSLLGKVRERDEAKIANILFNRGN